MLPGCDALFPCDLNSMQFSLVYNMTKKLFFWFALWFPLCESSLLTCRGQVLANYRKLTLLIAYKKAALQKGQGRANSLRVT